MKTQYLHNKFYLFGAFILLPVFVWVIWHFTVTDETLSGAVADYSLAGKEVIKDFQTMPALALTEGKDSYNLKDDTGNSIDIRYANAPEKSETEKNSLEISFPKDYAKPLEVKLDNERSIRITDASGNEEYTTSILTEEAARTQIIPGQKNFFERFFERDPEQPKKYLRYSSSDERKELFYAYQKDNATGEKKLKHWTIYSKGNGLEEEEYKFENAKLRLNDQGEAEVYYFATPKLDEEKAKGEVDGSLIERAQKTLEKEMQDQIMSGKGVPDFTVPAPFYIDRNGERHKAAWKINDEKNTLFLAIHTTPDTYPLALDPTLVFVAPGQSNTGDVINSEGGGLGRALVTGDFNSDGRVDLVVGADTSGDGRAYIFYNDGDLAANASAADVIISGDATNSTFGIALAAGDFNADGRTDLAVGGTDYSSSTGRTFIFYNDGSIPTAVASADITLTGAATSNYFGYSLTTGDFNIDGVTDIAVGAYGYSSSTGRAYIFHGGSSMDTTVDVTLTGVTAGDAFGRALAAGDLNADGITDIAVGAIDRSSSAGAVYIFHGGASMDTTADVTITGAASGNQFGYFLTTGDFNADGKIDLAAGAPGASSFTGSAYIFHNDGSIPTTAGTADVTITGVWNGLAAGDMNSDSRTDLIAGQSGYSDSTGRLCIFYNDGSIPTTGDTADVIITGEATSSQFGRYTAVGDLNSDGKMDIAAGADQFMSFTGRAFVFYSQNGLINTNQNITGETTSNRFGSAITTGDFNADGRVDLAVGASAYSTDTGRAYIFYNDGLFPTGAASAELTISGVASSGFGSSMASADMNADGVTDLIVGANIDSGQAGAAYIYYGGASMDATVDVTITGEGNSYFGTSLTTGDFNADGKTDLAVGAYGYSSDAGRAYIFYNDGSIPTTAATADVIITGEATSLFGQSMTSGDFNFDGEVDLAVGASDYSSSTGRAYIFHNDGSIPTTAATADVIITGAASGDKFGFSVASGDFNSDGRIDLVVGAENADSSNGRVYIFHNDGSIPTTAATADVTITGENGTRFGNLVFSGDFNSDGRTDVGVGAMGYDVSAGRAYIFHNDGSIPTTFATADMLFIGDVFDNYNFGVSAAVGDINYDGRTDLIIGAPGHTTATGKIYIYEGRENFSWELERVTGTTGLRSNTNVAGEELRVSGESGSGFGRSLTTGDLNGDGKIDLAVGAYDYSTNTGRVYVFYADGLLTVAAQSADVVITGETTSNYFGYSLATGDFNADRKVDIAVGARGHNSDTGRAYIFYNDGNVPTSAASADVTITGNATSDLFGTSLTAGDFNVDGKMDLAVGAAGYSTNTGRTYIFYGDGSIPTTAATADTTLTGVATSDLFGTSLISGDFNVDGETDLAVGAPGHSTNTGRAYIYYNASSAIETTIDVTFTGEATSNNFGYALVAADLNTDGETDLAIGAYGYSTSTGRAYIFHNGGTSIDTTADVTITGNAVSDSFGRSLSAGDFNADGDTDLAVGASSWAANTGTVYLFYNDGSVPTSALTADLSLNGESSSFFGYSLASIDFNLDGRMDLVSGAYGYASTTGRVYLYTFNDTVITGGASSNFFGYSLTSGDFNADGEIDLAVGAYGYTASTGRVYIFYNDGSLPGAVASADVTITGNATSDEFGKALVAGDFNVDGETDLAVGAPGYSTSTGRVYIFNGDGSIPTTAATADVTLTGGATTNLFGTALVAGDFNVDGETDLAIGAPGYSTNTGRAYVYNNASSVIEGTADVTLTGGATSDNFGYSLVSGDFNVDGELDLAVGAYGYSTSTGRAYIYYNESSAIGTGIDVTLTGEATSNNFGYSLFATDFNTDGETDLVVGAYGYSSSTGRVYIYNNESSAIETTADVTLTGGATSDNFGIALFAADFNYDGKKDLAVGASGYSSSAGRTYLYYNDSGAIETTIDVTLTGGGSTQFGKALVAVDLNNDGKDDIIVGAPQYTSNAGRTYVFISEAAVALTPPGTVHIKGNSSIKGDVQIK